MTGLEYLSADVLAALWTALDTAFRDAFAQSARPLQAFLHDRHPAWSVVGRVHFNLAEYKLRSGNTVRVSRDLHDVALCLRDRPARASRSRADRVRRRGEPVEIARAARADPARRRGLRLAEGHGGQRRRLPSPAVDRGRRLPLPALGTAVRGRGPHRASARIVERRAGRRARGRPRPSAQRRRPDWARARCSTSRWRSRSTARH